MPPPPPAPPISRQLRVPLFPREAKRLGEHMSVLTKDAVVWYYHYDLPVFSHAESDLASFRMFTSTLCDNGRCKLVDVEQTFSVSAISVKRALKQLREQGPKSFFAPRATWEVKPRVLTEDRLQEVQSLLDLGLAPRAIGEQLSLKADTIRRAIKDGRLHRPKKKGSRDEPVTESTGLGERSVADAQAAAGLGTACHDVPGRVQASLGGGGEKSPEFQLTPDCPGAGVLCAVPALLANGLLKQEEMLPHPPGYYSVKILLMLLSFLALSRRPSLEKVRYLLPGEWGRMLGLDRIPEVRTLRAKLEALSQPAAVAAWSQALSQGWMQLDESLCGLLYLDGHVRAYTGSQTSLPRRFSSRNRLCLPSLMDYWVNDCEGKPFFVVTAMGTEGMSHYLKTEIVPRLLRDVPNQPSEEALAADPTLHRFIIVFDRECWSVELFTWLWRTYRIAIITYQRGTYQPWPKQDFHPHLVQLPFGHTRQMNLAERPFQHPAAQATETQPEVSLREIRRLCDDSEHQTSIIATVRTGVMATLAGHVFSRKSQENYFKYGSYEFHIDQLPGYALAEPPPGQTVMSPAYVELTNQNNRLRATIRKLRAERDRLTLSSQESREVSAYQTKHADLTQRIQQHECEKKDILAKRRQQPKRIRIDSLPEDQRPSLIAPVRLQFINAIRMTADRAEMAMVALLRQYLARSDDAHNLIKDLFAHHADIIPDHQAKTLTIRVHNFASPMANQAIEKLFVDLNSTETVFPNTDLVMRFELVSPANPRDQEV